MISVTGAVAAVALLLVAGAMGTLLPGSSFDTSNGSLTSSSNHDWNPPGSPAGNVGPVQPIACGPAFPSNGTNCALDFVNSSSDNAFGQGTKEDSTSPTVVTGSIPPQKDDLTRFYINQEKGSNGDNFLYLAWQRTNLLGSAHMDFELNQANVGVTSSSTGTVALNRTAGDVLIDFDFGGSGAVVLSYHTWLATGTNAGTQCQASNTFPCWSAGTTLSPSVASASSTWPTSTTTTRPCRVPASTSWRVARATTERSRRRSARRESTCRRPGSSRRACASTSATPG
jgi:hypothetical protein